MYHLSVTHNEKKKRQEIWFLVFSLPPFYIPLFPPTFAFPITLPL